MRKIAFDYVRNRQSGDATMKNIYDVLRKKESDLEQLQREIEALRIAARLLAEDGDAPSITARSRTRQYFSPHTALPVPVNR